MNSSDQPGLAPAWDDPYSLTLSCEHESNLLNDSEVQEEDECADESLLLDRKLCSSIPSDEGHKILAVGVKRLIFTGWYCSAGNLPPPDRIV